MRRLLPILLGLAYAGAPARAAATSCYFQEWVGLVDAGELRGTTLPSDGLPWELVPCPHTNEPPTEPPNCLLLDASETIAIPVDFDISDADDCDIDPDDSYSGAPDFLLRYVPQQPLIPGETYTLRCDDIQTTPEITVTADPALDPPAVEVIDSYYVRQDGCCGIGDEIEVTLAAIDPAFFDQGGHVEATYHTGETLVFGATADDRYIFPPTRDLVTLVAVSASGARGKRYLFNTRGIDGDLVLSDCSVADTASPMRLWLLLPLAWVAARRPRRRRP